MKAWMRTLHVYASLAAFVLLLFFTVTGWLMVHEEALGLDRVRTVVTEHALPAGVTGGEMEEYVRRSLGVRGVLVEAGDGLMQFRRAGGRR